MKPVLFFGEALYDCFLDSDGTQRDELPGGSALNAAVGAARLEIPVAFSGGIGGDAHGQALLRLMDREKIGRRYVFYKKDLPTTTSQVRQSAQGEPSFAFHRSGCADEAVTVDDVADIDPRAFSALHCAGVMLASEPGASAQEALVKKFYDAGVPVSFDLNARPALVKEKQRYCQRALQLMLKSQLAKFSTDDLLWFFPDEDVNTGFAALCQARRGALTVMTAGVQGSLIASGGVCERLYAYSVDVVDATGCGDGYAAGLIHGLLRLPEGTPWDGLTSEQVRWIGSGASAVAARVCQKRGAIAAMPRLSDVFSPQGTSQ
ncbi:MAG: carbohydrate kinase family protein [Pyramidobacter sp.]|jgi:fructokinase